MTAPALHLAGYEINPNLPLRDQAASLRAELAAAAVFVDQAEDDVLGGDIRAFGRLEALENHLDQLRQRLAEVSKTL